MELGRQELRGVLVAVGCFCAARKKEAQKRAGRFASKNKRNKENPKVWHVKEWKRQLFCEPIKYKTGKTFE